MLKKLQILSIRQPICKGKCHLLYIKNEPTFIDSPPNRCLTAVMLVKITKQMKYLLLEG